jgi:hypothetical protein
VTVLDPSHPLFGRRFRVARWGMGPSALHGRVYVFLRNELTLCLPASAIAPPSEQVVSKLSAGSVGDLVAAFGRLDV